MPSLGTPPAHGDDEAQVSCTYCGHVYEVAQVVRLKDGLYEYSCTDCAIRSEHGKMTAELASGDEEAKGDGSQPQGE